MVNKYFLEQLIDNLKRPGRQNTVGGAMVAIPDFMFGAKLQMTLEAASNLVRLHKTVERAITNTIIQ